MYSQKISGGKRFVLDWLGPVIIVFFLFVSLLYSILASFTLRGLMSILPMAMPLVAIALATALVTARKGAVDMSFGGAMALSSMLIGSAALNGIAWIGILGALLICIAFGMLNGILVVFLKAHSYIVTLLSGITIRIFAAFFSFTSAQAPSRFHLTFFGLMDRDISVLLLIIIAAGIAVGLYFIAHATEKKAKFLAVLPFVGSSVIAMFVGYLSTVRIGSIIPSTSTSYDLTIIYFWAVLASSRLLGRTPIALAFALVPALCSALQSYALTVSFLIPAFKNLIEIFLAFSFIIIAYVFHNLRSRWLGEQIPLLS